MGSACPMATKLPYVLRSSGQVARSLRDGVGGFINSIMSGFS
jgi:hypothetical protein